MSANPQTASHRATLAAVVVAGALIAAVPAAHALPLATSLYQDCSEAFLKNASALVKKRAQTLVKCSNQLLACKLDDELGSGDFAACSMEVAGNCNESLAKLSSGEDSARTKLDKVCSELADYDFRLSTTLGLRRVEAECGAVNTAAQAYDCLISRVRCRAADIVESLAPRAYELLSAAGVLAAHPESAACFDTRAPAMPVAGDPEALADCQAGLAKALLKPMVRTPKDVAPCIGDLLECRLHADRLRVNDTQPPDCYSEKAPESSCAQAETRLLSALGGDVVTKAVEECSEVGVADLLAALNFDAVCPGSASLVAALDCARDLAAGSTLELVDDAAPRSCQLSQESGRALFTHGSFCSPECGNNVVEVGETCDDGNGDGLDTCNNLCQPGPTGTLSVTIPTSRQPAHTPDGTPATALDPGNSVAQMFGTTMPDLNKVSYLRYFAPGAGDPDAVLILVPGFSGGSHSLKIVAETMVANAAAEGNIVLEVWAFDRRTDQLEDDSGGELAETEDDPDLAMNWYFGEELGLALDPRLTRRAIFHTSADVAFTANYTFHLVVHDIDDVVNAAQALPGSPTVFLGGHSLGTLLAAHYAATDLDPGVALVPGYQKIAGLVLFEGEGDTIQTVPPSSDALDLVIAKSDGGLYHAIRNGDARCWDGTPCPGGDADCSALALPPGAFTNKCVSAIDAFPEDVVTPQIHAIGDAASLQARRNPDSLSVAQVDYGSGKAVDVVPGLSLLGFLAKGSAEAAAAFFLDDDFSPEVSFMVSMGFSDNGPNTDLGYYLAGNSTVDPYRYWKPTTASMPPEALPDHGAPVDPYLVTGVEREMTPMASVLTMLRTGDRNIGDWYFPVAGLYTTADLIIGDDFFKGLLDSTPLSVDRGRPDIENLTEGPNIDIPIICFGGSNGIAPTTGSFLPFAEDIGACTAPSCDGTPRIVLSDPIAPMFGDVAGGFEAYVAEGYAHLDIVAAPDSDAHATVYGPLLAFLERNTP